MAEVNSKPIFLLNPKHRDFKTTHTLFDDTLRGYLFGAIFIFLVGVFMILQALSAPSSPRLSQGFYVGPIPLLIGILTLILYFQKKREIQLLSRTGNVVLGRIADSRVQKKKLGEFVTSIDYYFTLPSGKLITDTQYQSRNDIQTDADLPPPGTPIAVVYANEKVYRVL